MSFGGDSSSSAATSNQTVDTTSTVTDNRVASGQAMVGGNVTTGPGDINGSLAISTTDFGAIKGGVDIALESMRGLQESNAAVKSVAADSISQAYDLAQSARQSETSGAINNLTKYLFWVALAGLSAYVIVKGNMK